jgi:hypothetical protein
MDGVYLEGIAGGIEIQLSINQFILDMDGRTSGRREPRATTHFDVENRPQG